MKGSVRTVINVHPRDDERAWVGDAEGLGRRVDNFYVTECTGDLDPMPQVGKSEKEAWLKGRKLHTSS